MQPAPASRSTRSPPSFPTAWWSAWQRSPRTWTRAYANNTKRAWRASWRVWVEFCEATGAPRLLATLDTLRAFLRARIATGKRRATLELNVSTLAMVHTLVGLSWPLDSKRVVSAH
jgi:hypothetical protein